MKTGLQAKDFWIEKLHVLTACQINPFYLKNKFTFYTFYKEFISIFLAWLVARMGQ